MLTAVDVNLHKDELIHLKAHIGAHTHKHPLHAKNPSGTPCLTPSLYSLVTLFASQGLIYLHIRHSFRSAFCGNEVTSAKSGHVCAGRWHKTHLEHLRIRCSELTVGGR